MAVYTENLTKKERHELEDKLLMETDRVLAMFKESIPDGGHLSLTAFPNGHMDVSIYSGKQTEDGKRAIMVCDAWGRMKNGRMEAHRIE